MKRVKKRGLRYAIYSTNDNYINIEMITLFPFNSEGYFHQKRRLNISAIEI